MTNYDRLRAFAETDHEARVIDALQATGTQDAAAEKLGIPGRTLRYHLRKMKLRQASRSVGADFVEKDLVSGEALVPDPYLVTRHTILMKGADERLHWFRADLDKGRRDEMLREMEAAFTETLPVYKRAPAPARVMAELANMYLLTDYHLGMMAWGEECGEDWDLEKSETLLLAWARYAVEHAPDAELGILAQLGDFLHFDGMSPVTPTHGHQLDAAARFQKVVRTAIRVLRTVIDLMLTKHSRVVVVMATGNHDIDSSVWLREMFHHVYQNEPRLTVDLSPDMYYAVEWGDTSLFFHHGHRKKMSDISATFVGKFRPMFGGTRFSYGHTGHLHHRDMKEDNLMVVEQHRTLAPSDAHTSGSGFTTGRSTPVVTYHKRFGEVGRLTVSPEMVAVPIDIR
jgi:hypothetical protein